MPIKPPAKKIFEAPLKGTKGKGFFSSYGFPLIMALATAVILAGGYLLYHFQEQQMRQRAESGLSIVADLKADQISEWRNERLMTANILVGSPFFAEGVEKYLASPTDTEAKDKVLARLAVIEKSYPYQDILLTNTNGEVLLSLNNSLNQLSDTTLAHLAVAIKEQTAVMVDFHYPPGGNSPHLDVIAPIFTWGQDSPQAMGAVIFTIDPAQYLYPLLQSFTIPSQTGEVLLVERDGDHVLYLNELLHQQDTALKLRIPLSRQDVPAVMAVLGKEGVFEGKDYRGIAVLAALQPIPDSPWYLVAKIDTSEALASWRSRSGFIIASLAGLLAAALAIIGLVWQRRQRQVYQKLYEAEARRKKMAKELVDSETKYRRLFETAQDAILILDGETGQIIDANPFIKDMLGYTLEELQGKHLWEIGTFRDIVASQAAFKELAKQGYIRYEHLPLQGKDGRQIDVEFVSNKYTVDSQEVFQCNIRNITERKQAEQRQKLSLKIPATLNQQGEWSELVHNILELIKEFSGCEAVGIRLQEGEDYPYYEASGFVRGHVEAENRLCAVDRKGAIIRDATGNPVLECMCGNIIQGRFDPTKPFFTEGGSFWTNCTTELLASTTEEDRQARTRNRCNGEGYESVALIPLKTGSTIIGLLQLNDSRRNRFTPELIAFYEGIGQSIGVVLARIRAEEALERSEERYRTILEGMDESYYEVDLAGNFTFVNDSLCRRLGHSREELISMNYRAYTPKEASKDAFKTFNQVYRTGKPVKGTHSVAIASDGSLILSERSVFPLLDKKGNIIGFRGISRDVTEKRMAEDNRRQLEQKAQIASRLASVGEMAAGVAHEINNPLTAVTGYAQLLVERDDLPADIRSDLAAINDGAQRVAGIVQRLLAFSRQTKPQRKYVDINDLIESTLILRAYHLRVNNIEVVTRLYPGLLETVVDPGQIQQVILNLIVNAETEMKLAHNKGKLTITTEKSDNTIRISIKDNGPGIKPEVMDKIFNPFFTTREVGQGTGLGLSLCYGIITEHKGKIHAESKPGKGATFIIELPVVEEILSPEQAKLQFEPGKAIKGRILVVDDEQGIRDIVKRVLAKEGHKVEATDNADDALKKVKDKKYDLILVDIKMPGMNGLELFKRIRKIDKSLAGKVVFITGDIMSADTEKFLFETKVPHISKPFDARQLKREVKRALSGDSVGPDI